MAEKDTRFPIFFTLMLIALSVLMIIGIFLGSSFVGVLFFISLLVVIVFTILDKKYGKQLASHEDYYLFVDIICLIAISAIMYYEDANQSKILKIFLALLGTSIGVLILLDFLYCKDEFYVKKECLIIDFTQICSMICILAYFYKVSEFWFAVVALVFEIINIILRVVFTTKQKKLLETQSETTGSDKILENQEVSVEDKISSNNEQGDME